MIAENIIDLIGKTPMVKLGRIAFGCEAEVVAKLESFNPGGSVKDRIAYGMILDAEERGLIDRESVIIEPTSGNTGVGLALVCARLGYRLILTMPEGMSVERCKLFKKYGAELELTPADKGMRGAIERAEELVGGMKKGFMPQQFMNMSNPEVHRVTTAEEIWSDANGVVDVFVAGVGTGGTITGVGEVLRKKNPNVKIVAVEPENSSVLSGGNPGAHKIQGIGAGFIPSVLNSSIYNEVVRVSDEEALLMTDRLAKEEGILCGYSSGAALVAAIRIAKRVENRGKRIVVLFADTGERYLSGFKL